MSTAVLGNRIVTGVSPAGRAFAALVGTPADPAATVARISLGAMMLPHGMQKMLGAFGGLGFAGTMKMFTESMHVPAPFAFLAIAAEFFGALGLLTGVLGRVAAFGVASTMLVAVLTVHLANGFFMNWTGQQHGEGFEFHLLALGLALVVMIRGSGALSGDRLLSRTR